MTMRQYVCLFCKHPVTLRRVKPYKNIYACDECIKSNGGMEASVTMVPDLIETFQKRAPLTGMRL